MSTVRLNQSLQAMAQILVADQPLADTLHRVATLAQEALPAAGVGVTLLNEHRAPTTAVATNTIAPEVDAAQYREDAGPCLTAYREGRVIRIDDAREVANRWPAFSDAATAKGIWSSLSFPLQAGGWAYGAFNLYAAERHAFCEEREADAAVFASQAAVALANASAYWQVAEQVAGLQEAMKSRAVIEQAKGMIMASRHCSDNEAFQILVAASQRRNVKLRELARRIVDAAHPTP